MGYFWIYINSFLFKCVQVLCLYLQNNQWVAFYPGDGVLNVVDKYVAS